MPRFIMLGFKMTYLAMIDNLDIFDFVFYNTRFEDFVACTVL